MKTPLLCLLLAVGLLNLPGCSSLSPERKHAIGQAVKSTVLQVALSAAQQYASNGSVDRQQLAFDAISGAAGLLRSLETPEVPSPSSVHQAIVAGSGHPEFAARIAPSVVVTVQRAIAEGAPPHEALEHAARGLDQAARAIAEVGP